MQTVVQWKTFIGEENVVVYMTSRVDVATYSQILSLTALARHAQPIVYYSITVFLYIELSFLS